MCMSILQRLPTKMEQQKQGCFAPTPAIDDRWARDVKDDLKIAVDLVCEFKEKLDKLHPLCLDIVSTWLRA